MELLLTSIYTIDRQQNAVFKNIPNKESNFEEYFNKVLLKIADNVEIKNFLPKSSNTQIISSISKLIEIRDVKEKSDALFEEISKRLLEKEIATQEKIKRLKREVQIGSLMQALFYNKTEKQYMYLIAKVGHIDFINQKGLSSATGFPKDIKLYKSCVVFLNSDKEVQGIRVHLDTVSKYWYDDFLELRELSSDETNTDRAFNSIDGYLNRSVKKNYPEDRASLRNSFIHYFRQTTMMNYNDMVNQIFDNYIPINNNFSKEEFRIAFLALPDKKGFERNFQVVSEIIKARIRTSYSIYPGITMKVTDNRNVINSITENGKNYLKIEVTDETTFNEFKYKR
ncbi:TPA: hypothetical protein TXL48_000668 [Streptococcus suis]|nr:hypothetical protein [Streptococcus suis]HEM3970033.1 hypothetical protein [Streptococcus suis]HEM3982322.1 hypothetical protein [Streptococcus suis]